MSQEITSDMPQWRKPVLRVPLSQAFPQLGEVREFKSRICLFNSNRTQLFDVVSPRYQLVEHTAAVDRVVHALETYFGTEVEYSVRTLKGGARISAEFKLPCPPVKLRDGKDVNEITLQLRNSYDRSCVFSATLGAFRLICSNGMKIGEQFGGLSARHVGGGDGEFAQDTILEDLDVMIQNAPRLRELWEEWIDTRVTQEEAVDLLEGQFPAKYLAPLLEASEYPQSRWDLYNKLTYFSSHETKSVARQMEFDDKIANLFYTGVRVPVGV